MTATFIGVLILIGLFIFANIKLNEQQREEEKASKPQVEETTETTSNSEYAQDQAKYIEKWGEPKEGFIWTDDGQLQAIGSIDKTPEDVIYSYVRSLSTLDFANAQRYSYKTQTVDTYQKYYDTESEFTYNKDFEKNMYKEVLLSLKPNKIVDMATFADFTQAVTLEVEVLDLTNKDFWLDDREKLFEELKKYKIVERDTTKMKEFLYNYVLEYYQSPEPKTRTVKVSFVMEQTTEGAWLVTNDADLDAVAKYQDGETVVSQIIEQFDKYTGGLDLTEEKSKDYDDNADELLDHDGGNYTESGTVDYNDSSSTRDTGSFTDEELVEGNDGEDDTGSFSDSDFEESYKGTGANQ